MPRLPMPKSVKVGPHTYTVTRRPTSEMSDCLGECDFTRVQIKIRKRMLLSKAQETLLHEVLHTCTHPSLNADETAYTDEEFVTGVAPTLFQVLRDNPDLVAYLTQ